MQDVSVWLSWRPRGVWRALGVRGLRDRVGKLVSLSVWGLDSRRTCYAYIEM